MKNFWRQKADQNFKNSLKIDLLMRTIMRIAIFLELPSPILTEQQFSPNLLHHIQY